MTVAAAVGNTTPQRTPEPEPIVPASFNATAMGGRFVIHLDVEWSGRQPVRGAGRHDGRAAADNGADAAADARRDAHVVSDRVHRWAERLTRHTETSDLSVLNSDPRSVIPVRPTLAAALLAAMVAADASEGFADVTLLDARLAAEEGREHTGASRIGEWQILRRHRGSGIVRRPPGLRFDLGGVGKGWIADRALDLLSDWPSAVVDADGDLAVRTAAGRAWEVGVADPRSPDTHLTVLRLAAPAGGLPVRWGVATSGVSIHRWPSDGAAAEPARHHLIDPRTGRPAVTDVVQATVVAESALRAEALAKSAVIAGSVDGFALLERSRVRGAVLLTAKGDVLALPVTLPLLDR